MAKAAISFVAPATSAIPDIYKRRPIPEISKIGRGAVASPEVGYILGLPAPDASGPFSYGVPVVTPPDTITDATERAKWQKEAGRKIANRLSGITRRLSKKDPLLKFSIRAIEEDGVPLVVVWRLDPFASTPTTASATAAS